MFWQKCKTASFREFAVGSLKNNKLLVRDEVVAVLSQYGYTPTDSVVIAPTLGLNTAATYPSNSTNMYTSFCNTGTDAGIWLRDHVTSLVRQASNSEILNNSLNMSDTAEPGSCFKKI
jgi:hypothetical protein